MDDADDVESMSRPLNRAERDAKRAREEAAERKRKFERREGPADDLGQVLLKLGRRAFAHHVNLRRLWTDYRDDLRDRALVKACDNDEERAQWVKDRTETARARAQEHLSKALAFGLEGFMTRLEIQRGYASACFDRLRAFLDRPYERFVERMVATDDDGIQHATVKSIVLHELIKDILKGDDELLDKLSKEQRRGLFDFAMGVTKEPPDVLAPFFKDSPRSRPPGVPETRRKPPKRMKTVNLGEINRVPEDKRTRTLDIESHLLEERDLAVYVGPCISLPPPWLDKSHPWADARCMSAPLDVEIIEPRELAKAIDGIDPPFDVPRLSSLGKVRLKLTFQMSKWFDAHRDAVTKMPQFLQYQDNVKVHALEQPTDLVLPYRVIVALPAIRTDIEVLFGISCPWPDLRD